MNLILKVHGSGNMFGRTQQIEVDEKDERIKKLELEVAGLKKLIVDEMFPKYKELDRREQVNRDSIHSVNERCSGNKSDLIKLWNEKDKEKEAHDQKFTSVRRIIREMQDELDKKANRTKPAPAKPPKA